MFLNWTTQHQLNLFFLINIVRVLVTKLRAVNSPDTHQTRKAVRATLILIPLLGLQYVLMPFRPPPGSPGEFFYEMISAAFTSFQGLCVAMLFCFCNGEVIKVLQQCFTVHKIQLPTPKSSSSVLSRNSKRSRDNNTTVVNITSNHSPHIPNHINHSSKISLQNNTTTTAADHINHNNLHLQSPNNHHTIISYNPCHPQLTTASSSPNDLNISPKSIQSTV